MPRPHVVAHSEDAPPVAFDRILAYRPASVLESVVYGAKPSWRKLHVHATPEYSCVCDYRLKVIQLGRNGGP